MDTLGEMRAAINRSLREELDADLINDAINDAIENAWESLIQANVSNFVAGPVNITIANAAERVKLVSIATPTAVPVVSEVAGGTQAVRTYSISYTLVTASGSETLESGITEHLVSGANQLVSVASPAYDAEAIGWNCYAGLTSARRARQNDVPIPFDVAFEETPMGWTDEPEKPSPPTENSTGDNIWYISHLEVQTTDGTYKSWNQADIDATLMRASAGRLAAASEFQNYYWDLLTGRQLELRPPAGIAQVPRAFYLQKPRRLRFDNAQLPFQQLTAVAFIRYHALSDLCLVLHEYTAADRWEQKAENKRFAMLQAVLQQNKGKNQRIVPFMR